MALWMKRAALAAVSVLALTLVGGCNNEMKDENARLKGEVEQLRTENQSLAQQNQATQAQVQQMQATVESLKTAPPTATTGGGGGSSRSSRGSSGGEVITIAGDVAFGSGQATLTPAGRKELDGIAARIKREHPSNDIRIEGFTDSDPIRKSKWGSNEALSQARAEAVEKYLQSKGVNNSMSAVGRGAASPKSSKAASRRVEIKILAN